MTSAAIAAEVKYCFEVFYVIFDSTDLCNAYGIFTG